MQKIHHAKARLRTPFRTAAKEDIDTTQHQRPKLGLKNVVRRDPYFGGNMDNKIYSVPTIKEIRERFGVPQTLGMSDDAKMALDSQIEVAGGFNLLQHGFEMGMYGSAASFMGYSALQSIAQNGLIRACIETTADDMTRNWIELQRQAENPDGEVSSEDEKYDQDEDIIEKLKKEMVRLDLQRVMHDAVAMTGYYGGCLIYLDTGVPAEGLATPLYMDPVYSSEANKRGFLRRLQVIDPINVSPGLCNFNNPLAPDYYKPKTWMVLGTPVHESRLIRIVANEAPLVFRPAYNFLGIPQAQLLWDYVLHFQANRDSANRLLSKFSSTILKTAMSDILQGSADDDNQLDTRIQLYVRERSNDGVMVIDKEMEDIIKLETPLGGVPDIVRQSLEILAAMNRTPAVKLLGISPSGFNATGESDLRNYYDYILSQQEKQMRSALNKLLQIMQLSLVGDIDNSISFDFCSLSEDDESTKIATQKSKVDTYMTLLNGGVISPEEVRQMLIADPDSGMNDLDPDDIPEQPMEGMEGLMGGMMPGQEEDAQAQAQEEQQKSDAVRQELFGGAQDEWTGAEDAERWITVHPHGPENEGQPVLIDDATMEVKAGMGGKFNGQKISEIGKNKSPSGTEPVAKKVKPTLVGYEWRSTTGDKYSAREEGFVEGKVSDWDNAEQSELSGRKIVHVYWIKDENGEVKPYGIESAKKMLGWTSDRQAKKSIKPFVDKIEKDRAFVSGSFDDMADRIKRGYAAIDDGEEMRRFSSDPAKVLNFGRHSVAVGNYKGGDYSMRENAIFFEDGKGYYGVFTVGIGKDDPSKDTVESMLNEKGFKIIPWKELKERRLASPQDTDLETKSWESGKDEKGYTQKGLKEILQSVNGRIEFGEASANDRTMKQFPELQQAYDDIAKKGAPISRDFEEIVRDAGGEMYGKEHGIKGAKSLERKIKDKKKPQATPQDTFNRMTDVVRFTALTDDQNIPDFTKKFIENFQKKGYNLVEVENKWNDSNPYCGLHFLFEKDGVTFEAQVHSPQGMSIKNKLHHYYEIERDKDRPMAEREDARNKQIEIAKGYVRPQGIEVFTDWSLKEDGGSYNGGK